MKQKIIYIVLLIMAMYLPASSRECVSFCACPEVKTKMPADAAVVAVTEDQDLLPASPSGRLLLNL